MVPEDPVRATSKMTEVNERSEVNFYVILRIPPLFGGNDNYQLSIENCPRLLCKQSSPVGGFLFVATP
jgi:hypothetical protein